ncbi:unnamed protein product [Brachionus calyciflorus]|uniref:WH2 domain-containing protein n=1 Tax=Brachionus calyciflorus TaxID=104777 RepID=A0A813QC74_9BILA|nr:unnamed protein product [Brachionus calyciflorus]
MSQRTFSVSLISHDLHREEAICQIANTLDYLDKTFDEVFTRITNCVQSSRDKIQKFDQRINLIDAKINRLKGSKKPVKICSSAKYPIEVDTEFIPKNEADNEDNFYEALAFQEYKNKIDKNWKNLYFADKPFSMKHKIQKYSTPYAQLDELAFKEKFKEYSAENVFKYDSTKSESVHNGLGNVLEDRIKSVSSLLLFNTAQHPYKQNDLKDPLEDLDLKKNKKGIFDQDSKAELYEAPMSILKGEQLETVKKENLTFKPKLGDVPDFNVPAFLPDLSGIADISYAQDLPSIAPSNLIVNDLADILPEIPSGILPEDIINQPVVSTNQSISSTVAPPPPPPPPMMADLSSMPPPPPPPPILNISTNAPPPPPPPPPLGLPPPPPPPPLSLDMPPAPPVPKTEPRVVQPEPEDPHNELMNAIRNFGGDKSKLKLTKNIEDRKTEKKKKEQAAKEIGGSLSIMDQIKLEMEKRRKFIADNDDDKKKSNDDVAPPDNSNSNETKQTDEIDFGESEDEWDT